MGNKRVIWDKQAALYFRDAIRFIREDSFQNADKVKRQILEKIKQIGMYPEIHAPDKYKLNNKGN